MSEQDAADKKAEEILAQMESRMRKMGVVTTAHYDAGRELIAAALRAKEAELEAAREELGNEICANAELRLQVEQAEVARKQAIENAEYWAKECAKYQNAVSPQDVKE